MEDIEKIHTAVVCWFSKGFGFLKPDDGGADVFVHFSDIVSSGGYKTLQKDDKVTYKIGKNKRGQDKAIEVTVIK